MQRVQDDKFMLRYELNETPINAMSAKVEAASSLCCIKALNYVSNVLGVQNDLLTGSLGQGSIIKMYWFVMGETKETEWLRYILVLAFRRLFFERKIVRMEDFFKGLSVYETEKIKDVVEQYGINDELLDRLNSHLYFRKARTEYFKQLSTCKEVKAVCFKHNEFDNLEKADFRVDSASFSDYIEAFIPETKIVDHAKMYIVSPVIVKGKSIKWKGNYKGQDVNFQMMAGQFKTEAQNAEIVFRTGSYIDCKLQFEETFDENENPLHNGYKVLVVYGHGYDDNYTETMEGKKIRNDANQLVMFQDPED